MDHLAGLTGLEPRGCRVRVHASRHMEEMHTTEPHQLLLGNSWKFDQVFPMLSVILNAVVGLMIWVSIDCSVAFFYEI